MGRILVQIFIGILGALAASFAFLAYAKKRRQERETMQQLAQKNAELEAALKEQTPPPPAPTPTAPRHRFWVWLYSNANLLGTVLALLGLGLYLGGIINEGWWLIIPGLYLAGYLIAPRPPQAKPISQAQLDLSTALDAMQQRAQQGLSAERLQTFDRLITSLRDALPLLEAQSTGDRSAYTLRQTILDYLPATLDNYLRLPRAYRQMHKLNDGRTPREVFVAQLDTLHNEVQSSIKALAENDTQQLLANERFLADRFSRPESF